MASRGRFGWRLMLGAGLLGGCSKPPPPDPQPAASVATPLASAPAPEAPVASWPERADVRFEPVEEPRSAGEGRPGTTLALAVVQGRKVALIADADQGALLVVDRATQAVRSRARLPGAPSQLVVRQHDGRVYVALRDRNVIQAYEANADLSLTLRGEMVTATEPVGLALTPDEHTLLVTTGWDHQLTGLSLASHTTSFQTTLPREPRAIVVDRGKAFVSHTVGSVLSVVDLPTDGSSSPEPRALALKGEDVVLRRPTINCRLRALHDDFMLEPLGFHPGESEPPRAPKPASCADSFLPAQFSSRSVHTPRFSVQGYALAMVGDLLFAPSVLVDPGETRHPSLGYGDAGAMVPPEAPTVATIATGTEKIAQGSLTIEGFVAPKACLLPRAALATMEAAGARVLVACQGIDAVIELDGQASNPARAERRRWSVPAGPTGLALDPQTKEVVVWSQFERAVSVLPSGAAKPGAKAGADRKTTTETTSFVLPADEPASRWLSDEARLGRKLFHTTGDARLAVDGRGCASCHPDGRDDGLTWSSPDGARNTPMLAGRLRGTEPFSWNGAHGTIREHMTHTLKRLHGKGVSEDEARWLQAYVESLPVPTRPASFTDAKVARGREVFRSAETMCSLCHSERAPFTDRQVHDVKSGAPLDTPSLLFVGGTAPYFHDGRYATLRDMLRDCDGKMGNTKHLLPADLDALEAYLGSI